MSGAADKWRASEKILAEHKLNGYCDNMLEFGPIIGRAVRLIRRMGLTWARLCRSKSVLQSWEQMTRTAGLGAIGLSLLATGEQVNPISLALGAVFLTLSTYFAYTLGVIVEKK